MNELTIDSARIKLVVAVPHILVILAVVLILVLLQLLLLHLLLLRLLLKHVWFEEYVIFRVLLFK